MIFLSCPICGKYPKVKTTHDTYNAICRISCRGLFKNHFEVRGMSYIIAAQNAVVAAQSLGIGSCYIGDIMENAEKQRQLLSLPSYVFPAAMLVFGYPTEQQIQRPKPPRSKMHHIVHENAYRDMDADELKEMLLVKAGVKDFEEWIQAFCERKYNSDFSKEMTRSVEVFLKDFEK